MLFAEKAQSKTIMNTQVLHIKLAILSRWGKQDGHVSSRGDAELQRKEQRAPEVRRQTVPSALGAGDLETWA